MPKLSIIILNLDAGQLLLDCLESLRADPIRSTREIILVDNGSVDGSVAAASAAYGDLLAEVIHTGRNGGFSWGNNHGLRAARGEYICLLNPDTVIYPGAFQALVDFMDDHPRAGIVGPKVLNSDGTLQISCRRMIPTPTDAISRALLLSRAFPRSRRLARLNLTWLEEDEIQRVEASTGCCMLARRALIDEIGGLDEGYFLYCEDVDWFLRAREAGWEVWYVPAAVIEHHDGYSAGFRPFRNTYHAHRSMIRFHRKHFAARYPAPFNGLLYAGVGARMGLHVAGRALSRSFFFRKTAKPREGGVSRGEIAHGMRRDP